MIYRTVACATAAMILSCVIAHADDFKDAVKESVEAYDKSDLVTARQSLGYASQLLAQKSAEQLADVLPAAQPGWTIKDQKSRNSGAMGVIGGIHAEQVYVKDGKTVTISILGDSPLIAQAMTIFSNPAIAGGMGKVTRINGRTAITSDKGKLTFVVANRFLVTIKGSAEISDKQAYAKEIDFSALEKF